MVIILIITSNLHRFTWTEDESRVMEAKQREVLDNPTPDRLTYPE